jgi:polysaccharide biosynthesis/export protein
LAEQLGIDCSRFEGPIIPVIYNMNFRPGWVFHGDQVRDAEQGRCLYSSNALSVEVSKFLNYTRLINGTINDPINMAISLYTLRNLARGAPSAVIVGTSMASGGN